VRAQETREDRRPGPDVVAHAEEVLGERAEVRARLPGHGARRRGQERVVVAQRRLPAAEVRREQGHAEGEHEQNGGTTETERGPHSAFLHSSRGPQSSCAASPIATTSVRLTSVDGKGVWLRGSGPGWSVPARTTGPPPVSRLKSATSWLHGLRPTMRRGMWSRFIASMIVTRRGRSSGLSSRSLMRIAIGLLSLSANAIWCASSSPAEISVPALNGCCHGLGG